MNRFKLLILAIATYASVSFGSEEEFLGWQTLTIKSPERVETGVVTVEATTNALSITKLSIEAFGRKTTLNEAELKKLEGFPLPSCVLTHEAGYAALGGHTVHMKLKRIYYDKQAKNTKTEEIVISVPKAAAARITKRNVP
jgi:hypothetical protein